jgi:hypothetical protein
VQAGGGAAAGVAGLQVADLVAGRDDVADRGRGCHGFVGGAQAAGVGDAHDATAGDPAGVDHRAGAGGADRGAGGGGEVGAAVSGQPRLRRRVERADDARLGDRPHEAVRRESREKRRHRSARHARRRQRNAKHGRRRHRSAKGARRRRAGQGKQQSEEHSHVGQHADPAGPPRPPVDNDPAAAICG